MIILIQRLRRTLEQKKYHLQKQIIEAIEAKDNDLYSLLKSQWAHRFGVESLEELESLDLTRLNQNTDNFSNQNTYRSQNNSLEGDKAIHQYDSQEKEINTTEVETVKDNKNDSFKIKSNKIDYKKEKSNQSIYKEDNEIKVLIPLPPNPKYGFLNKWLLRR